LIEVDITPSFLNYIVEEPMKRVHITMYEDLVSDGDKIYLECDGRRREMTEEDINELLYIYELPLAIVYELYE